MGLYDRFKTNANLEKTGIFQDFGDFRVKLARAGGSNTAYMTRMTALSKPHKRQIATDTLDRAVLRKIMLQCFAETIILDWETKTENGSFVQGIESEDGSIMPFTVENVINVCTDLPDLFDQLMETANMQELYNDSYLEQAVKN